MQPVERAFRKNYKTFFLSPEFLVAFNLRRKLSKLETLISFTEEVLRSEGKGKQYPYKCAVHPSISFRFAEK